jgi:ferredoxin
VKRLAVDWQQCDGHGLCAALLPELLDLDDWGYPVVVTVDVPPGLVRQARAAVRACPALALRLVQP